jgi:geranylgeranyl diphosphate synthase, type II
LSPLPPSAPRTRGARRAGSSDSFASRRATFERYLERAIRLRCDAPGRLGPAILYAALSPGKRLRPLLTLASCEAAGGQWSAALPAAAAIECVHAFSLAHDDLPAMDDDDFRRGLPTTHRKFGEATAILAGDALLSFAYQEVTRLANAGVSPKRIVEATRRLAIASGGEQLVGGQSLDLEAEGKRVRERDVFEIHRRKTGALFGAAMALGGLTAGASPARVDALDAAGRQLGLAFQVQDDLMDLGIGPRRRGRATGADAARGKATYPSAVGPERSSGVAASHLDLSLHILAEFRLDHPSLERLIAATAARMREGENGRTTPRKRSGSP